MKKRLIPYLYGFGFIFGCYFVLSLLMVAQSYFFPLNNTLRNSILTIGSYSIIVISAFIFIHFIRTKKIIHVCIFASIYTLLSILIAGGAIHFIHLILKPIVFILTGVLITIFTADE